MSTATSSKADKLFDLLTQKLNGSKNPKLTQRINAHIRSVSGHATLVNFHNNGSTEEQKVTAYGACLRYLLSGDETLLKGQVATGQAGRVQEVDTEDQEAGADGDEAGDNDGAKESEVEMEDESDVQVAEVQPAPEELGQEDATTKHSIPVTGYSGDEPDVNELARMLMRLSSPKKVEVDESKVLELIRRHGPGLIKDDILNYLKVPLAEIDTKLTEAMGKFNRAELESVVVSCLQSSVGKAFADGVTDGSLEILQPLLPVDPLYVRNAASLKVERAIKRSESFIISGPPGSGKTYPVENELRMMGRKYMGPISMGDGYTKKDFLAREVLTNKDGHVITKWRHGFLTKAMLNGQVLILDEISQLQKEVLSFIYYAIEYGRLILTETGEVIDAKPGFMVVGTDNALTDTTGLYSGYGLSIALTNRFRFVKADYMDTRSEISIFERVGVSNTVAVQLRNFLDKCRAAYKQGAITFAPSTRVGVQVCRQVVDGLPLREAVDYCMLDGLPDSESEKLAKLL